MKSHYGKFALVLVVNTIVMFLITYATIASFDHFQANLNRAYMALMMMAPMALLMLYVMRSMYPNKTLNIALYVLFAALLAGTFWAVRTQTPIGDEQFLRSMIPHHSGAILMCQQATITDPEITDLCRQIIQSQRDEIAQMEAILRRY